MSISEQVEELRRYVEAYKKQPFGREVEGTVRVLSDAADTIESLSAKLQAENVGRTENYGRCGNFCLHWNSVHGGCAIHNTVPEGCKDFCLVQKLNDSMDCGGGWIYCKDGNNLPEESGYYDVTIESKINDEVVRTTECRCFHKDIKLWIELIEPEFAIDEIVIAWRNRPEPYHEH